MQEVDNAKEQLIAEIEQLRQRIAELEQSEIERKRAENELRESEAAARVLLNAPADVAALVDTKGIILDVNEAMAQRLGRSVDELIGVHGWDLLPADIAERRKLYFDKTIQSGKLNRFEDESGGVWFETVFYPVRDEQGKVTKVALLTRDITEHKQAEEALRESEKRYRDIFETIPASIIVLDKNGHMIDINPYHLTQIAKGQTPKEDFVGKNILTHPTIV
ncbi:MAG: PAS domain S-box protein, partial [Deltaproteobacteria bacterium]|nr:PAS domain S-box protein [Deltaproteobacteria bacterium]